MPLKLNVGLSRKIGQPHYGSRGASLNLELELDCAAVDEPDRLHARIKHLYGLLKTSIDEELGTAETGGHGAAASCGRGAGCRGSQNGHSPECSRSARRYATPGQVRSIRAIAGKKQIDLPRLLQERFDTERADQLTVRDASILIEDLDARPAAVAS